MLIVYPWAWVHQSYDLERCVETNTPTVFELIYIPVLISPLKCGVTYHLRCDWRPTKKARSLSMNQVKKLVSKFDPLQQRMSGFRTVTIRYPRRICLIIKANAKISHQICNDCNEKKSSVDQLLCNDHIHDDKSSQLTRVVEMRRVCQQLFNVRFIVSFRNNCFWLLYTGSYQLIDTGCSIAQWRRAKNREYWISEKRGTFSYESHVVLIPTHPFSSHKIRM